MRRGKILRREDSRQRAAETGTGAAGLPPGLQLCYISAVNSRDCSPLCSTRGQYMQYSRTLWSAMQYGKIQYNTV
jgi:hypothetical protein